MSPATMSKSADERHGKSDFFRPFPYAAMSRASALPTVYFILLISEEIQMEDEILM